ncbi:hypothetical protein [Paenibacillus polymyxa]|uniref:hypothetical protein n=1 Tax=Paenibacillus polymyxa TaxID=1406 RepID=UPI0020253DED|nr:hypothetical protein [Paenibacillus polymyxa]URJ42209.3 hypothetical protein MF627_001868 [Paenibacillus polymyxa]
MKPIITVIISALLLSGCFYSSFDTYMRKGKDALINANYNEAIKNLDNALIEEPTNKDAIALMKKAKEKKEKSENKKVIDDFTKDTEEMYKKLKSLGDGINTMVDNVTYEEALSKVEILKPMNEKLVELNPKWQDDKVVGEAFSNLVSAYHNLNFTYRLVIESTEQPEPEITTTGNGEVSEFEAVRNRKIQPSLAFVDFRQNMESYKNTINKLKDNNQ